MLVYELIQKATDQLLSAGIKEAIDVDVQLLLSRCLRKTRTELLLARSELVEADQLKIFNSLLDRRIKREPVAYILGSQEFWSLDFEVNESVLIPRPETEFLLEQVLKDYTNSQIKTGLKVLDLCTGSGAIAIVLAKELNRDIIGVDLSCDALKVAEKNCFRHGVNDQVELLESDLFSCFTTASQFDLIVSNPPYIATSEVKTSLEPEVGVYEPNLALDGGEDGLQLIRRIRRDLPIFLTVEGRFFMEFGAGQGQDVKAIFQSVGSDGSYFEDIKIMKDYAGRNRVLSARFSGFARGANG